MAKDRDECILCRQDENDARDLGGFDEVCGEAIQPGGGTNGQGRESSTEVADAIYIGSAPYSHTTWGRPVR
jgi:hypothetical protein